MATKTTRKRKPTEVANVTSADLRSFRKTNEAIGLRVAEGTLTLLARKVFNVMIFHAQQQGEPGHNAPEDTPTASKYFWIPLSQLAREAAYDSRDTKHLREMLEQMQNIRLVLETERQWASERLVSSVTLVNPEGLHNKHAGQVWFGYAFPPHVHEQVMAPSTYTRLAIVFQSSLKSGAALALYEICKRYATNPSRRTAILSIEHWRGLLSGTAPELNEQFEYKYFKRDVLRPAIAEVNAITDIKVELIEHKVGRRIVNLQFLIEQSKQPQLEFDPQHLVIDDALLSSIERLGLTPNDARDVVAQYPDAIVRQALAQVEQRVQSRNMSEVASPAAYFRAGLKRLLSESSSAAQPQALAGPSAALSESEKVKVKPRATKKVAASAPEGSKVMERFLQSRADEAMAHYRKLTTLQQDQAFELFKETAGHMSIKLDRGLSSPPVSVLFSRWYATHLWGEPSTQALAAFFEQEAHQGR